MVSALLVAATLSLIDASIGWELRDLVESEGRSMTVVFGDDAFVLERIRRAVLVVVGLREFVAFRFALCDQIVVERFVDDEWFDQSPFALVHFPLALHLDRLSFTGGKVGRRGNVIGTVLHADDESLGS